MGILFSDSSTSVTLSPEYDYEHLPSKIQSRRRGIDGTEYVYNFGTYTEFSVPVEHVTSSDREQLYSWWLNNTSLVWQEDAGVTSEYTVRMTDDVFPLRKRNKPYFHQFMGTIKLSTF